MSISYTYASLLTALKDTVTDQSTEFSDALPNIIGLAETRLLRDLDLEMFDSVSTISFTQSSPLVLKPTGFVSLRALYYLDATNNFQVVELKPWEYVIDYWPNAATETATPKYMADYSTTQWYLAGTPNAGISGSVRYVKRPAGLSGSVSTTWLSENVGDLLFYSCLISAEEFLKADDRVDVWKGEYRDRLSAARMELRRDKRDDYAPVSGTPDATAQ